MFLPELRQARARRILTKSARLYGQYGPQTRRVRINGDGNDHAKTYRKRSWFPPFENREGWGSLGESELDGDSIGYEKTYCKRSWFPRFERRETWGIQRQE